MIWQGETFKHSVQHSKHYTWGIKGATIRRRKGHSWGIHRQWYHGCTWGLALWSCSMVLTLHWGDEWQGPRWASGGCSSAIGKWWGILGLLEGGWKGGNFLFKRDGRRFCSGEEDKETLSSLRERRAELTCGGGENLDPFQNSPKVLPAITTVIFIHASLWEVKTHFILISCCFRALCIQKKISYLFVQISKEQRENNKCFHES